MSSHNTRKRDQIPADRPGRPGVGRAKEWQIISGQAGRCSSCGEEISGSEAEVVLRHPDFPGDDLYFHEEVEECSEIALWLAEAYPDEWSCWMRVPVSYAPHTTNGTTVPLHVPEDENG